MPLPSFGKPFHLALLSLLTVLVAILASYMAQLSLLQSNIEGDSWNYWDWARYAPIVADRVITQPSLTTLTLEKVIRSQPEFIAKAILQVCSQLPTSTQESYWLLQVRQHSYEFIGNSTAAEDTMHLKKQLFPDL